MAEKLDLTKEAAAAKALRESLIAYGDEDLILDSVEGETSLFEAIDKTLTHMIEARAAAEGVSRVISDLADRRARFEDRAGACRAAIEQALMIAEIHQKIERPGATVFLSNRAPKVEIHTESDIPSQYWKASAPTLDKAALAAALKDGAVPGACLSNAAPTLTVRIK